MRMFGLPVSISDWPPSPPTDSNQLLPALVDFWLYDQVPLSCEPPITSVLGCWGLIARLWNCTVASPLFRLNISVGTAFNQLWQSVKSAPASPLLAQPPDASLKTPLVRTRPPSEPRKAISEFPGAKAIPCWSGCIPSGGDCMSSVRSVKLTPASVKRCTVHPFEGDLAVKISENCIDPPIHTESG